MVGGSFSAAIFFSSSAALFPAFWDFDSNNALFFVCVDDSPTQTSSLFFSSSRSSSSFTSESSFINDMSSISSPKAMAFSRTMVVKQSSISSSASVSMRSSFSSSSFFANREELMMPFVFFEAISSLVIIAASSASISSSFIAALNSLTLLLKTSNCFAETACKLAIVSANLLPSSSATSILFANSAATSPNATLVASALRIIGDNSRLVNLTLVPSLDTSREYLR